MIQKPFNCVEPIHYVDANTGAIVDTVMMRRFYDWNAGDPRRKPEFKLVRQYALDRESGLRSPKGRLTGA